MTTETRIDEAGASRCRNTASEFNPLALFHAPVREWFTRAFAAPTKPQTLGWPPIVHGESTLILAPTGTGKTLAAFLACIDRILFSPAPPKGRECRVVYVSPLKALAVDVERNLRAPIAGVTRLAEDQGIEVYVPRVFIRTGDTPSQDRARFRREPADILITTPESLYLMLTSSARDAMRSVETIIIDEIHALAPNKRGAHLALSLERLQVLCHKPLQRIGLSATQTPLEEVASFLGGMEESRGRPKKERNRKCSSSATLAPRPVTIIDANAKKPLALHVEVPIEDMAQIAEAPAPSSGFSPNPSLTSIWPSIHARLLEVIRSHRSTLIFVNNRRLAERLAAAVNDLAGETVVRSHHGSIAREQRLEIEERLKAGKIPALVATSSLELGIDMGAIDLVIQIEAPPSVASGLQRIGRANHHVGAVSRGLIYPKFRADLAACAAAARCMMDGLVETTRFPRNPLDVLAQQIVAMCAMEDWEVDNLYGTIRRAAPFAELGQSIFEDVLDMLSGRYPSHQFADLRPRITWDRVGGRLRARAGAKQVAIANGGTIPDRGLYGVFLAGEARAGLVRRGGSGRVGELDEEMVHESRVGEVFLLGASSWRIEEITHDRVLVSPAPGEPGKMPFWHGDRVGRPLEFGRKVGALIRELRGLAPDQAIERLETRHALDSAAARNLVAYLKEQLDCSALPDDQTLVIERHRDELGDWRVCVMTPLGGKVLAPWAMAIVTRVRDRLGVEVETMWSDDGMVIRFPGLEGPPEREWLLPAPDEVEGLVTCQLGSSALFAARFREIAARALLLPRRRPGSRTPLWQQRKRASDLLQIASRFGSFPMILETYRECLGDVFDMPALVEILRQIQTGALRVDVMDTQSPSPFASSLMFHYVANFIYDGDAPLAERRAQALMVDPTQLRELMGETPMRELLDPISLEELESQLQCLSDSRKARHADGLHDLLLRLGDLSIDQILLRVSSPQAAMTWIDQLQQEHRILLTMVGGERRLISIEDGARYRDALGILLPRGIPDSLLRPVTDPAADLFRRYARTRGPFRIEDLVARFGVAPARASRVLRKLERDGALVGGEFRPGGQSQEWCDAEVLRALRRKSLARLRRQVEPVPPPVLGRFLVDWQGVAQKRIGAEGLLDVIEQLQGIPIPASVLETDVLTARVQEYEPADLDLLCAAGKVIWIGMGSLGERDGRIALFLADGASALRTLPESRSSPSCSDMLIPPQSADRHEKIRSFLRSHGASFFAAIHQAAEGGYPGDTLNVLWDLVWSGEVTNDTLMPLRHRMNAVPERRRHHTGRPVGSRSVVPPAGEGRWSLVSNLLRFEQSPTQRASAWAEQLLIRYGILTREAMGAEPLPGGFSAIYSVLKAMEERGRVRRGYFVEGLGAAQFAWPQALDRLRQMRDPPEEDQVVVLAATDPANPYGAALRWPPVRSGGTGEPEGRGTGEPGSRGAGEPASVLRGPTRSAGCYVILINGALAAFIGRGESQFFVFLPKEVPERSRMAGGIAGALVAWIRGGARKRLFISTINGSPADESELAPALLEAGFVAASGGFMLRRSLPSGGAVDAQPSRA